MIKKRGEFVDVTEQIELTVQFRDVDGTPVNTDSYPTVGIVQPSGLSLLSPTSVGVYQTDIGRYNYLFTVPYNGPYGVFNDVWVGYVNGFRVQVQFEFIVSHTQMPAINTDGYVSIGDDPGLQYSQCAIRNLNKLLKALKARLNSSGKSKTTDEHGNVIYVDCDIYTYDQLVSFLVMSLTLFNETPYFTFFTFDDDNFVEQFFYVLVEGASLFALASKALVERGNEGNISDNSINWTPPSVSELLNSQYSAALTTHWDRLKMIKASLRPFPLGMGKFTMNNGSINPAISRLRHLKARRFY